MTRILLTGMSGTGKSTVVSELRARGHEAIDADDDGWSHWMDLRTGQPARAPAPGVYAWDDLDWVWNEERMLELLTRDDEDTLFIAGTAANQGQFHPHFDHIVLLSAPAEVIRERLAARTDNSYGATPRTRARALQHIATVEPMLRAGADVEIDTCRPLVEVLEIVLRIAEQAGTRSRRDTSGDPGARELT